MPLTQAPLSFPTRLAALALLAGCQSTGEPAHPAAPAPAPPVAAAAPAVHEHSYPAGEAGRLLQLARENNSTLGQARARVEQARAELGQADAALRPRFSIDAALTAADSPSMYLMKAIDSHSLQPNTDFNHPGSFQSTEAGLALRWNLWNGGRDQLGREAAGAMVEAREAEVDAVYDALARSVLAAWIELGIARELQQADLGSVAALRSSVESTTRRVEAGSALRADQLSLEVRLAEAEERAGAARLAAHLAAASLRRLCGPGAESSTGASEDATFDAPPETLEAAQAEALGARADLRALERAIAGSEKQLEAENRSSRPTLDLEGRVYAVALDIDPALDEPNASLTLGLHWDLTDGGARRARRESAGAALRELQERRRAQEESVLQEVENAWWQLEHAHSRLALAEARLRAADETFTLVEAQLSEGSATVSRFLEAESDRASARATRAQARLGLIGSQAVLVTALGRWSP